MRFMSLLAFLPLVLGTVHVARADSLDKNKAVVRRFEEEFKNKANHAIADELMAADYKAHGFGPVAFDRAALVQLGKGIVAAFPDVHATIAAWIRDTLAAHN